MKTRAVFPLIIFYSSVLGAVVRAQATNPQYLSQMPSVERVKAEIKGSDAVDTSARQMSALSQLVEMSDWSRATSDHSSSECNERVRTQNGFLTISC